MKRRAFLTTLPAALLLSSGALRAAGEHALPLPLAETMLAGFILARAIKNAAEPRAGRGDYAGRVGRRMPATSAVGYGTSTEAGVFPATPATTHPVSSSAAAGTTTPSGGSTSGEV